MVERQYLYGKVNYTSLVKARDFLAEISDKSKNRYYGSNKKRKPNQFSNRQQQKPSSNCP